VPDQDPGRGRDSGRGRDARLTRAQRLYERAVFSSDDGALETADLELDGVEADLALARGRNIHTRFLDQRDLDASSAAEDPDELPLFERAVSLYRRLGDAAGEAEALFWVGCFHQVVRGDNSAAVPFLEQSLALASEVAGGGGRAGAEETMSEVLRHLGIAAHRAGDLDVARERLEESNRLRRPADLLPGVAANLIGLAYIAAAQGRPADALAHLDEAEAIATSTSAHRVLHHITEARTNLT
jgi:tetratricopeptide (TPR) repeat protein